MNWYSIVGVAGSVTMQSESGTKHCKQSHCYDVWFAEECTWTARVTWPAAYIRAKRALSASLTVSKKNCVLQKNVVLLRKNLLLLRAESNSGAVDLESHWWISDLIALIQKVNISLLITI